MVIIVIHSSAQRIHRVAAGAICIGVCGFLDFILFILMVGVAIVLLRGQAQRRFVVGPFNADGEHVVIAGVPFISYHTAQRKRDSFALSKAVNFG